MAAATFYADPITDGQYAWVRPNRSRRHRRNSHHHADHSVEYIQVPAVQWEALVERERAFQEANEAFARENEALKFKFRDAQAEKNTQLQAQVAQLNKSYAKVYKDYTDAVELANKHYNDGKLLRAKIDKLKADNDELGAEVRRLKRDLDHAKEKQCDHESHHHGLRHKLEELTQLVESWKRRWQDSDGQVEEYKRKVARLESDIKDQDDTIATYEKMLRRHSLVRGEY